MLSAASDGVEVDVLVIVAIVLVDEIVLSAEAITTFVLGFVVLVVLVVLLVLVVVVLVVVVSGYAPRSNVQPLLCSVARKASSSGHSAFC